MSVQSEESGLLMGEVKSDEDKDNGGRSEFAAATRLVLSLPMLPPTHCHALTFSPLLFSLWNACRLLLRCSQNGVPDGPVEDG